MPGAITTLFSHRRNPAEKQAVFLLHLIFPHIKFTTVVTIFRELSGIAYELQERNPADTLIPALFILMDWILRGSKGFFAEPTPPIHPADATVLPAILGIPHGPKN